MRWSEEKLRESYDLLAAVLKETTDIVFVKDLHGLYLMVSARGAATIGMSVDEIIAESQKDGDSDGEDHEASAEELVLDRAPRPWVKGGAIVGIVLALALGGVLLRK